MKQKMASYNKKPARVELNASSLSAFKTSYSVHSLKNHGHHQRTLKHACLSDYPARVLRKDLLLAVYTHKFMRFACLVSVYSFRQRAEPRQLNKYTTKLLRPINRGPHARQELFSIHEVHIRQPDQRDCSSESCCTDQQWALHINL